MVLPDSCFHGHTQPYAGGSAETLRATHLYAKLGWPILPLYGATGDGRCTCPISSCASPGKHPSLPRGVLAATTEVRQINKLLATRPRANIGIATGPASGLLVLDIDPRHGGDEGLARLQKLHGKLPPTLKVWTGGGGFHLYFKDPGGVRSSAGLLGDGLDVRADGGYVVAPPSLHVSGRRYRWAGDTADLTSVAPTPPWLIQLLSRASQANPSGMLQAMSSHPARSFIPEGKRNVTLTSICGSILRAVQAPQLAFDVVSLVNARSCQPPLPHSEVRKIVTNICALDRARRGGANHAER